MKFNKWTLGLAAVGVVSLASAARADETNMLMTSLSSTTISGYVDIAAQFTPQSTGAAPNYYYGQPGNSINLNVVDIAIDHPEDSTPWAAGYHVEFFVGPVAQAMGLNNDIRQAYITLRTPVGNGIDWKIGIFDTIVGYESTTTGNNPNYTHSYGYNMEPTTHTGILGSYTVNSIVSVEAGVADTAYQGAGAYNVGTPSAGLYLPTIMGGLTLTAPDSFGWAKGATLSADIINTSGNVAGNSDPVSYNGAGGTSYYAGITLPTPIAALNFGASFDYLNARDVSGNEWDGALYSTYKFTDKLSLNLRAEYFEGKPLNNAGAYNGGGPGLPGNDAQEVTATLQYALWANVLTRLEVRWDHSNSTGYPYVSNTGGTQQNAFLLAAQAVYTF
jgi:hypothetical protein